MLFRLLRPITVLAMSAKANTKALLRACEPVGLNPDEIVLGFRKGYQRAELISARRLLVERHLEWQTPLFFAQLDFAKAYDSVMHTAVWRSMRRRGVPEVLVSSYLREIRATKLCFQHGAWSTAPLRPGAAGLYLVAHDLPVVTVRRYGNAAVKLERTGPWTRHCRASFASPCVGRRHLACGHVARRLKCDDPGINGGNPECRVGAPPLVVQVGSGEARRPEGRRAQALAYRIGRDVPRSRKAVHAAARSTSTYASRQRGRTR